MNVYVNGIEYTEDKVVAYTSVSNLEDLKTAIAAGGIVKLEADIENMTEALNVTDGKNVVINLNGKKVTASSSAFQVLGKSTLVVGGNGTVESEQYAIGNYGGTLIVQDGTYKGTGANVATIYCDGIGYDGDQVTYGGVDSDWHLIIDGGTFVSENVTSVSLQNNFYQLQEEGSATLNGGIFTGGGNWYDLYVGCAKVNYNIEKCAFTNSRIYTKVEPSIPCYSYINGTEYTTDGLINQN